MTALPGIDWLKLTKVGIRHLDPPGTFPRIEDYVLVGKRETPKEAASE